MPSSEEEGKVKNIQITDLAANIEGSNMEAIAEGLFGISHVTVRHKKEENKGSTEGFNRAMIRIWTWQNGEGNQIKVCVLSLIFSCWRGSYLRDFTFMAQLFGKRDLNHQVLHF